MKKTKLRKWVKILLGTLMFISFTVMATIDSENQIAFIISKFTSLAVFVGCFLILNKYSAFEE